MDNLLAILNIVALIVVPVIVVWMGQLLQDRAEKRKDKLRVFQTLMTARIYGWTKESVEALNTIDIIFVDDQGVRAAWKDLYDKLCVSNADPQHFEKIQKAQYKLLEEISNALGYKGKISWETIQSVYVPKGLTEQLTAQATYNNNMSMVAENIKKIVSDKNKE
jgi:hypothetical protein